MKKDMEESTSKLNRISKTTNFTFNVIFIILSLICILPVVFVFMISITSENSLARYGYQFIPKEISAASYIFLWNEIHTILKALGISVLVTVVGTVLGVALTTTMGYVLSRSNYKLNGFLTYLVFIPMIFNGGMISSYVINTNLLGLKDSIWALILPLMVSSFNVIICKTFFRTTIPDSIIESAKIDGASQLNIFTRIVVPISKPVFATIGLFLCFGYWNDWFQSSLYINNANLLSLQALLNNIQKNIQFLANNPSAGLSLQQYKNLMPKEGARMAIAIVIIAPIACAYPFFQKYFISGLTIGAVKG
ncbi:carbohydrate ABC transporter permease [Anaerocolumna sp. AGMB13025]|uniref:carbohydrate ABC transporter permease n=1 Tax=Anaerocolumna sp. AGMB13025 TaxID=3039116 RepID=UPI00241EAA9E|nr:carbohydrate ABC transporter permease [Anaerocolumna sp. AGMB13025]WFR55242.1 carbohydrate ABC transporter permease [Anaerocolumna sp. AGMB13025]